MMDIFNYMGSRIELEDTETPQMYGAKADGSTDDTTAIQAAIEANKGGTVYFPPGIYVISAPISNYPSEANYTHIFMHHDAVVRARSSVSYLFDIGGKSESFTRAVGTRKKFFAGGFLDASNGMVTMAAVHIDNDICDVDLSNCEIRTSGCSGIILGEENASAKSTDAYVHHVIIRHNSGENTSSGIIVYSNDNSISDSRVYYNQTAIRLNGGSTYVDNIHTLANTAADSVSFLINGKDVYMTNVYGDSEDTFIRAIGASQIAICNSQYYSYRTNAVTLFDFSAASALKVNGLNITCKSENTHVGLKIPYNALGTQLSNAMFDISGLYIKGAEYLRNGDPVKGANTRNGHPAFEATSMTQNTWYHLGTFATDDAIQKALEFTCSGRYTRVPLNISCSSTGALQGNINSGKVITDDDATYQLGFSLSNSGFNSASDYPRVNVYIRRTTSSSRTIQDFGILSQHIIPVSTPSASPTTALQSASVTPTLVYAVNCANGTLSAVS